MWSMVWPVVMVVMSNVFYNICQKSTPDGINPFAALLVTYLTAALLTTILFICTAGVHNMPKEFLKLNWTSFVLGMAIIGLEVGYIFLYRAGWKVSAGSVVCNIALAIVLIFVGMLLYKETITLKQLVGIVVCSAGLFLITG